MAAAISASLFPAPPLDFFGGSSFSGKKRRTMNGMIFILKTKTQSSKMLVILLFSTTGVGILFLLYDIEKMDSFLDVALIFVLLSSVSAIVFAKRLRYKSVDDE